MKQIELIRILAKQAYFTAYKLMDRGYRSNSSGGHFNNGERALSNRVWRPQTGDLVVEVSAISLWHDEGRCCRTLEKSIGYVQEFEIEKEGHGVFSKSSYTIKTLSGETIKWNNSSFVAIADTGWGFPKEKYDHSLCNNYNDACEHCLEDLSRWMDDTGIPNSNPKEYHWGRSNEEQKDLWEKFKEYENEQTD